MQANVAAAPNNPYILFIEKNSDVDYNEKVDRMMATVDGLAAEANEAERERMFAAFERSMNLEWMFWDGAYRLEQWPKFTGGRSSAEP